ncbi:putative carboxylesterase [Helianthus anomalus]
MPSNDILVNGGTNNAEKKLEEFEAYMMCVINDYSVSPDIFVEGTSLMKWWDDYKAHKGIAYVYKFAQYRNNKTYESYK